MRNFGPEKLRIWTVFMDWTQKFREKIFVFSPNTRNYGPEKTTIWTLFMQWQYMLFTEVEYLDNSEFLKFFQDITWKSNIFRLHGCSFVSHGFPRFLRKYSRLIIPQNWEKQKSWVGRQADWELHAVSQRRCIFHGSNKHVPKPVSAMRSNKLVSSLKVH